MQNNHHSVTILMADDDADDRQMTKEAFAHARLANDLRFVEDGVELLDYVFRRGKYTDAATSPFPSIILLDLNMPRKDGREALKELRANPRFRGIRGSHRREWNDRRHHGCNTQVL